MTDCTAGDRGLTVLLAATLFIGLVAGWPDVEAHEAVRLDSYAEWRSPGALVVDGQRVIADERTRWKGTFAAIEEVPLGDEVRVRGTRQPDGAVLAREIDVRPNGTALFEAEVRQGTNQLEGLWLRTGEAFEADPRGRKVAIGEVMRTGPDVTRVNRIVTRVTPRYLNRSALRVYVIDNPEWNAMAMGNGAIWVFRGILDDMSDNELAIVVGHELAHYTHEHSRRQMRKAMWVQLGSLAALAAASSIDSQGWRTLAQLGSALGFSAWVSGYGRDLEDQADRVGLRYAYEGGYDVSRAPRVWERFLEKYGQGSRLTNYFFSNHSLASARRQNLEQEIRFNYSGR